MSDLNEDIAHVKKNINKCLTMKYTILDTRTFEYEDFEENRVSSKDVFQSLLLFFNKSQNLIFLKEDEELLYSSLLLCGEHTSLNDMSDDEARSLSREVLRLVEETVGCNVCDFLIQANRQRIHGTALFDRLSLVLTKDEWKYYPVTVYCFCWLLQMVKMGQMKSFIHVVLPISVNFMDDYTVKNKVIGLNCLFHILSNITSSELQWHVQIELLQNILKPLLYYRESDIIVPLMKCVMKLNEKSQFPTVDVDLNWNFLDESLSVVLPLMEYEQDMSRRSAYADALYIILSEAKFGIAKWTTRILNIIENYCKLSNTELPAIQALKCFVRNCWPLVEKQWRKICVISGKLAYTTSNENAVKEAAIIFNIVSKLVPKDIPIPCIEDILSKKVVKV